MEITAPAYQQAALCEPILRALPDWFGIEEAVRQYVQDIDALPTLLAWEDGRCAGFLSIKQHNPFSAEVYVTGVLPEYQRRGAGSRLLAAAEDYLRGLGVEYLQVKTLAPSHPDPFYARTRAFYHKVGFRPLEAFERIWNADNPCLILIKRL